MDHTSSITESRFRVDSGQILASFGKWQCCVKLIPSGNDVDYNEWCDDETIVEEREGRAASACIITYLYWGDWHVSRSGVQLRTEEGQRGMMVFQRASMLDIWAIFLNRREWIQLKGCIFSRPAPARGREARKRNPSIASLPTAL